MRTKVLSLVLCSAALAVGLAGCDGNAIRQNVDGTWLLKVEFNFCDLPGIFKGGNRSETINVQQQGETVSSSFQDSEGNDVDMLGQMVGGQLISGWAVHTPQGREIYLNSEARLHDDGQELLMDGFMIVADDSDFDCINEQFGFWGFINPITVPQTPEEVVRQCPGVDICFVMDTSGSMNDEAAALCAAISGVKSDLLALGLSQINVQILGITSRKASNPDFSCLTDDVRSLFGSAVPGNPSSGNENLDDSEDWAPGTAVVAARKQWTPGFVRIVVPISDEGPEDGDPCAGPENDAAIANAIAVANANNVIVSPIAAGSPETPPDPCVLDHAIDLANGTGGTASQSSDPALSFSQSIFDLIVEACRDVPVQT